jgi:hypothetical protein
VNPPPTVASTSISPVTRGACRSTTVSKRRVLEFPVVGSNCRRHRIRLVD